MAMEYVESAGARIPKLGFGTFQLDDDNAREMVRTALEAGYRHIDTAQMYGNETGVGRGIADAGVPREDIWLTTKAWVDRFRDGDLQRSARESLARLGVDSVDLLLLHWPNPDIPLEEAIGALNDVRDQGLARHIGVSNFPVALVREAEGLSRAPLVTDQVEYHPYLSQAPLLEALRERGMALTAYCPLGQGGVLNDGTIAAIARDHDRTPAQVILRWHYQQPGVVAIPRSRRAEHVRANFDILGFSLSDEEMRRISGLARADGRVVNPAGLAPEWDNAG